MKFMMIITPKDQGHAAPDAVPSSAQLLMMKYNEGLSKAGVLLDVNGLYPPSTGTRISYDKAGKPTVIDGPFTEAKEFIGGYWVIQVKSREEAIQWASRIPCIAEATVEVRQINEITEIPPEFQDKAKPNR